MLNYRSKIVTCHLLRMRVIYVGFIKVLLLNYFLVRIVSYSLYSALVRVRLSFGHSRIKALIGRFEKGAT